MDGNGQANAGDFIDLLVTSGPYMGYRNRGSPQGNITVTQEAPG